MLSETFLRHQQQTPTQLEQNKVVTMFAWIEAGRCNTFQAIGPKDVVFRTASLSNNIVLGNSCNSDAAACAYVHENRLGVHRIPMQGANLDVVGNAAVSRALSIYDASVHQSNFDVRAPACTHLTHSNVCITSQSSYGASMFYADSLGFARTHSTVASARQQVVAALSNLTVTSVERSSSNSLSVTIADDARGPTFDAMRKGATIVVGNTCYAVAQVRASADAQTLDLTSSTSAVLRRDDVLGAGSNIVVEIVDDVHRRTIETTWVSLRLNACAYESRSQGHVMRIICNDGSLPRAFQDVRSFVGEFVAIGTAANAESGRAVVVRVLSASDVFDAQQGFYFDACAPDMSAFADAASQYLQFADGDALVVRPLAPARDDCVAERALSAVTASRGSSATQLTLTLTDDDDADARTWLARRVRPSDDQEGTANGIVRIAIATPDDGTLRLNVVASSYDATARTLALQILDDDESLIAGVFPVQGHALQDCAVRVRVVGHMVLVTTAALVDATRTALSLDMAAGIDPGLEADMTQAAGAFDAFAFVSGASASALMHRILSFEPTDGTLLVRPWSYQSASVAALPPDSRVSIVLVKPVLRSRLADATAPPMRLTGGVCVGDVCAPPPSAALAVAGEARIESKLSIADASTSTTTAELTFSSNVVSIGHAPAAIANERMPQATRPAGISITQSNVHVRYPLLVDGQITAKTVRTTSDARLKKNVQATRAKDDLQNLLAIDVKRFHFIDEDDDATKHVGVIAQAVAPIVPSAVGRTAGMVPLRTPIECMTVHGRSDIVVVSSPSTLSSTDSANALEPGKTLLWRCRHPVIASGSAVVASYDGMSGVIALVDALPPALPATGGITIEVHGCNDDIHVIDTTELLCVTMSAVKDIHRELMAIKAQIHAASLL